MPTQEERAHHYLWRIRQALPRPGYIGVFDRSHYEDVLVVRVAGLVPPEVWAARYDEINAFEREVTDAGMSERLEKSARAIPGVWEVENLLHLPGAEAPTS